MTLERLLTSVPGVTRRDAESLAAYALGCDRPAVLAHPERELSAHESVALLALLNRRALGEPLQYITGEQEFYGLPLAVSPAVLIPRPETELLVEQVVAWAATGSVPHRADASGERTLRLLDVGTGSGAIAIALATQLANVEVIALDTSVAAIEVARANAQRHGVDDRIQFLRSDLLEVLIEQGALEKSPSANKTAVFDAIVSNPPYVPAGDAATMQHEVVAHEPHSALFAGADGLEIYRRLIPQAQQFLRAGGLLALEFGFGQRDALAALLDGWSEVCFVDDLAGIPRVALATKS